MDLHLRKRQLSELNKALEDRPLSHDDPRYFPFHTWNGNPRGLDPIKQLKSAMELNELQGGGSTSCQVFSGFRGSGKSTELRRLQGELEAEGYTVLFVEGANYINLFKPLETVDLLLSVAAAVAEEVSRRTGQNVAKQGLLQRLGNFLSNTFVDFQSLDVGVSVIKLKGELSRNPTFKEQIQISQRGRTLELVQAFAAFMEDAHRALNLPAGAPQPLLIVDDLEKVRGSGPEQDAVQQSVEQIFSQFNWALKIPGWHTIWTAPPYLQLMNPSIPKLFDGCAVLPMVRVWQNNPERKPDPVGVAALREFLRLRGDIAGLVDTPDLLDTVILSASGHLRDLVRLCRNMVVRVFGSTDPTKPLGETELFELLDTHMQDYLRTVYDEDLPWLRQVSQTRSIDVPNETLILRAAKLLDTHIVMIYRNGQQWFDVNAAIRGKVP